MNWIWWFFFQYVFHSKNQSKYFEVIYMKAIFILKQKIEFQSIDIQLIQKFFFWCGRLYHWVRNERHCIFIQRTHKYIVTSKILTTLLHTIRSTVVVDTVVVVVGVSISYRQKAWFSDEQFVFTHLHSGLRWRLNVLNVSWYFCTVNGLILIFFVSVFFRLSSDCVNVCAFLKLFGKLVVHTLIKLIDWLLNFVHQKYINIKCKCYGKFNSAIAFSVGDCRFICDLVKFEMKNSMIMWW